MAKREPEPAAEVVKHSAYLRLVSRSFNTYFGKMPLDLHFTTPLSRAQLRWLKAEHRPPVRSLRLRSALTFGAGAGDTGWADVEALLASQPYDLAETITRHCASSLERLDGHVVDSDYGEEYLKRLTTFPNLRMLRLLCPRESMQTCIIKPQAWEREWFAQEAPDKELPASWLTLRRWPQAGTEKHQQAKRLHARAMAVLQELTDAWDNGPDDWELDPEDLAEVEAGGRDCEGLTYADIGDLNTAISLKYARKMR